jgi:hypothetical protein
MSDVKVKLTDGSLPEEAKRRLKGTDLYDEDEEDMDYDSWKDIMHLSLGPFTIEYDHYTKELTVTGGILADVDCIGDEVDLIPIQYCRTLVVRPSE